jgi:hypothetical protein
MSKELAEVKYDAIVHETEKAYLINFGGKEVWLPKSMIEVDIDTMTVTMPERLAIEKEIV